MDLYKCITLPLLLQPIVENAILHGLEETEQGGMVTIQIGQETGSEGIYIAVSDNGCGMDKRDTRASEGGYRDEKSNEKRKHWII